MISQVQNPKNKIKTAADYSEKQAAIQVTYMQWISRSEQAISN